MPGRILSTNISESDESEIIESEEIASIVFSVCLGEECLVLIFLACAQGMLSIKMQKNINKAFIGCVVCDVGSRCGHSQDRLLVDLREGRR